MNLTVRDLRAKINGMKRLLVLPLLFVGLIACGGRQDDHSIEDEIRACVDSGGTPQFTSDKYGYVIQYFGCVK